jgi:hypothetical protein
MMSFPDRRQEEEETYPCARGSLRWIETSLDSGDIRVTDTAVRAVLAPAGSHYFLHLIDDAESPNASLLEMMF